MPIAYSSVLYYPTIDIGDGAWLRNALLFWDRVYTIVPVSHNNPYHNAFSNEAHEMGMLLPLHVSSDMDEVRDLTEVVEDFITDPATTDLLLSRGNERISPDKLSHEALRQHASDIYASGIMPALKSLKESIQLRSWESGIQGVLKASTYTAAPATLAMFAGTPAPVALLAGLGISVVASGVQIYRNRRETLNNSPYSYLLSLQQIEGYRASQAYIRAPLP